MLRERARSTARLVLASALLALGLSTIPAAPATAAPQGCGYANSSAANGQFASTICWFDFTAFDITQARSANGQQMQVTLDGGYIATFTVRFADVAGTLPMSVERRSTPLETRFAFGTDAYRGVPGLHSLYSLPAPSGVKGGRLTFDTIKIVDALGSPVSGFSFVAADTEDNVLGESFAWSSDKPLNEIERLAPAGNWGCKTPIGLGTTQVTCAGTGAGGTTIAGGKSTALLVAANTPTTFETQWITGARSGIAVGIQTAKLTVLKQVASRANATDSFDVKVISSTGSTLGSGSTGAAGTATTGAVTVLAGGTFSLFEQATAGSSTVLSNYLTAWSCTNSSTASTTILPSGSATIQSVTPAAGDNIVCTVTNTARSAAITLQKHAGTPTDVNGNGIVDVGDAIPYTFTVSNAGVAFLVSVAVSDAKVGAVTCPSGSLASGAQMTCTADSAYTVTAGDSAAGAVINSATASASPLGSASVVTSPPSTTSTPVETPAPALTLVKSATPSAPASYVAGQPITYSFVVTNSGNVTITGVVVTDTAFTGTGALGPINCPVGSDTLLAGEQAICTADYTLTQPDVDAGTLNNSAIASGVPVGGPPPVTTPPATFALPVNPAPAVTLQKTATPAVASSPGDVIGYTFAVTNAGNVTLSAATVTETAFTGSGTALSPVCPPGPFVPGARVTCTATYSLTQVDVNAGTVSNTATASATPPTGADVDSPPSTATVTIAAAPALTLVKSAALTGAGVAGDTVSYSFVVSNSGNVTVDGVAVNETSFSGSGALGAPTCPGTTLDSGDVMTCTAAYVLTQADVDTGEVDNTAEAIGDPAGPAASVTSASSSASVPTVRTAALALVKSAGPVSRGGAVTYSFRVTNTGTVTVSGVSIAETAFSGAGPLPVATCPGGSLAPGSSVTCSAPYTVTAADARARTITNTATASAVGPVGVAPPTSAASTVALALGAQPGFDPLALTGSTIAWGAGASALALILTGAAILVSRRRFSRESNIP